MRVLEVKEIEAAIKSASIDVNVNVTKEMADAIDDALSKEESPVGRDVLQQLKTNAQIAREKGIPFCQDTGVSIVYVKLGKEVDLRGNLLEAINKGVAAGYTEGYLRKSVVSDPIRRVNTKNNTPVMFHLELIEGDRVHITFMAKGTGAENMSRLKMLTPAEGVEGVKRFALETVQLAGPNACPPLNIGVGIGGTFEEVGWLAKKALMRPMGTRNPDPEYAAMELDLLKRMNDLGVGPMGFGGRMTALDVRIEFAPCHIGALPVAVNIDCHAHRVKEMVI